MGASRPKPHAARSAPKSAEAALSLTLASDFVSARKAQKLILDKIAAVGFGEQACFGVKLAMEEAMINAIKHGNKLDATKKVRIEAKITPDSATITIEDEGSGFKRHAVPDPTLEENIEKCSGRGILLMEAYMDKVSWDRKGRRVRMIKHNRPDLHPR